MHAVHDQKDRDANIRSQKAAGAPVLGPKHREAVRQTEQREHDHGDVCAVGLQGAVVGGLDALGGARLAEAQVHDGAADPGGHTPGVGEVDEPAEHLAAIGGDVEVG